MFCSRCGKKVLEYMLFCPFCGTEIVVPDQQAASEVESEAKPGFDFEASGSEPAESAEPAFPHPEVDDGSAEETDDAPFTFDKPRMEPVEEPDEAPLERFKAGGPRRDELSWGRDEGDSGSLEDSLFGTEDDEPEQTPFDRFEVEQANDRQKEPAYYRHGESATGKSTETYPEITRRSQRQSGGGRKSESERDERVRKYAGVSSTSPRLDRSERYAPVKSTSEDDMFMDDVADDYDDYDAYEDRLEADYRSSRRSAAKSQRRRYHDDDDDDDDDERDEDSGFLMRHIRGIVGAILFLVLILVLVLYFLSDAGQASLARINATLPIKSEIYAELGKQSYEAGDFRQPGVYYERALARDPQSYNWASSAVMSYIAEENTDKAVEMLKKCIEINPQAVEPYYYLMTLYPDASSRPWDVAQLIQQGYQMTGDARLNVYG